MSNLYARLKAVSAQAKESEKTPRQVKPCALIRSFFENCGDFLSDGDVRRMCELENLAPAKKSDLIFIDTETTGLGRGAGTVAFLVGIGWFEGGGFLCNQLWMRDYDEEEDLLTRLTEMISGSGKVLVSFNGKSFDMPLLEGRYVMNRMRMPKLESIDLLTHARRVYKLRLKRVKLSYLEEMVLGEARIGDLPGAEVPQRYFDFLKTGNAALLDDVFEHNAKDVLSMGRIMGELARAYGEPEKLRFDEDIFSVGKVYERMGDSLRAESCYKLAKNGYRVQSVARLSFMYKRSKRLGEAMEGFLEIACEDAGACVELAKYHEHKLRDFDRALDFTDRAIALTDDEFALEDLIKRRRRLLGKVEKRIKEVIENGGIQG